ncbi:carbohydrate sulfotransferase 11-like [Apostichopus japonicus]|uniref:carbohydrate sulfotransferase 11-like n=1 Tax=Stichopus japonicus TaxID=307972 RepID=UPI003AB6F182
MNAKSYVGILVFIVLLLCIIQVYQRAEITDLTLDRNYVTSSIKKEGQKDSNVSKLKQISVLKVWKDSTASKDGGVIEDSYQKHLMSRLTDSYSTNSPYFDNHLETQRKRHAQLYSACSSMGYESYDSPSKNIWVNDKYKFVYCSIPKVACTSWKSILLVLDGVADSTDQFSQRTINSKSGRWMKQLWKYPIHQQKFILQNYTKFMFSRDPFSRVLSAFRNKLSPNSTFERAKFWQAKIGGHILSRYRSTWQKGDPYDLKFSEFAHFINSGHGFNKHWNLQYRQCRPCDIDYTILGHFETLQEDSEFVLKVIGADKDVSFPSSNHSSPTNSSDESIFTSFYKTLSDKELRDLYQTYAKDYELFNYPLPERLKNTKT